MVPTSSDVSCKTPRERGSLDMMRCVVHSPPASDQHSHIWSMYGPGPCRSPQPRRSGAYLPSFIHPKRVLGRNDSDPGPRRVTRATGVLIATMLWGGVGRTHCVCTTRPKTFFRPFRLRAILSGRPYNRTFVARNRRDLGSKRRSNEGE
ncbi:hypothetical protein BC938DRAFT_473778 [Jimgerdemannia flammicorona]|uniref:Uncharacterized protein n=1 Tax=Jimgerdemannia flammicorona TaxID=994334 RepID=A0A433Q3C9_9FUNG|nr:hypothetical protein BC938DRAFT_473778 [Jimgerdemannia flammicorona]